MSTVSTVPTHHPQRRHARSRSSASACSRSPPDGHRRGGDARAFEVGYRHIDTAEMYGNEAGRRRGHRAPSGRRPRRGLRHQQAEQRLPPPRRRAPARSTQTLAALGLDHVDLFLIHWPLPTLYDGDYVSTWKALEEFKADGRARSIGVSNFQVAHLERLAAETDVVPAVNQIEVHPYLLNEEVRAYGEEHGIATEAWSPIAQGGVLDDPVITEIAERASAARRRRWCCAGTSQRGNIVFPKSTTPARIEENFELFDFELADADMAGDRGAGQGRGRAHRARTRTSSPTSRD